MTFRKTTDKRDVRQEITDKVLAAMELAANHGNAWEKPWLPVHPVSAPYNETTGAFYRGVNVLTLGVTAAVNGYEGNAWATFKQWKDAGASVRKGERGTPVVYYGTAVRETEQPDTGETDRDVFRFLKYSIAFNVAQVDGYTLELPIRPTPSLAERVEHAEGYVHNTGATIHHGGDRACYIPSLDVIHMPRAVQFVPTAAGSSATENYYSTLFHELTHWTKHNSRLNRDFGRTRWGDAGYAMEELVAELGAAFLCGQHRISATPRDDHARYLNNWIAVLQKDKSAIFKAAAAAQQAVDYLDTTQAAPITAAA